MFFFFPFLFFSLDHEFSSSTIADRITSRMAFNIFSTSINICSLARYFFFVSFSSYGNRERVPLPYAWIHTRTHTRIFTTHTHTHAGSLKYTYVRMRGSQSKRDRGRFFGTFSTEERIKCCRTLANMASCLLALWSDRSLDWYHRPVCTHTHRNVSMCVIQCVRRMTPEIACLFAARQLSLGNYNAFH